MIKKVLATQTKPFQFKELETLSQQIDAHLKSVKETTLKNLKQNFPDKALVLEYSLYFTDDEFWRTLVKIMADDQPAWETYIFRALMSEYLKKLKRSPSKNKRILKMINLLGDPDCAKKYLSKILPLNKQCDLIKKVFPKDIAKVYLHELCKITDQERLRRSEGSHYFEFLDRNELVEPFDHFERFEGLQRLESLNHCCQNETLLTSGEPSVSYTTTSLLPNVISAHLPPPSSPHNLTPPEAPLNNTPPSHQPQSFTPVVTLGLFKLMSEQAEPVEDLQENFPEILPQDVSITYPPQLLPPSEFFLSPDSQVSTYLLQEEIEETEERKPIVTLEDGEFTSERLCELLETAPKGKLKLKNVCCDNCIIYLDEQLDLNFVDKPFFKNENLWAALQKHSANFTLEAEVLNFDELGHLPNTLPELQTLRLRGKVIDDSTFFKQDSTSTHESKITSLRFPKLLHLTLDNLHLDSEDCKKLNWDTLTTLHLHNIRYQNKYPIPWDELNHLNTLTLSGFDCPDIQIENSDLPKLKSLNGYFMSLDTLKDETKVEGADKLLTALPQPLLKRLKKLKLGYHRKPSENMQKRIQKRGFSIAIRASDKQSNELFSRFILLGVNGEKSKL